MMNESTCYWKNIFNQDLVELPKDGVKKANKLIMKSFLNFIVNIKVLKPDTMHIYINNNLVIIKVFSRNIFAPIVLEMCC